MTEGQQHHRRPIYLDANSTTPLSPVAFEAMRPFFLDAFANPASAHAAGRRARRALEEYRERLAARLGAHPDEVVFTSGATEANNLAVAGLAGDPPGLLLAAAIEHPSVLEPLAHLASTGFRLCEIPVDSSGLIQVDALPGLAGSDARLAAVMLANHETGALQPVRAAIEALAPSGAAVHCDATQAVGKVPVDFHHLGASTLALSAHKFHGPRGVGALLVRRGVRLRPLTRGGHQQQGRRPGTEPVALVAGMVVALEEAVAAMAERAGHFCRLRELFLGRLRDARPVVNGPADGLPSTVNVSFPGLRADALVMALDLAAVACSAGAACASGSLLPSPVLRAMGVPDEVLRGAVRFSFHAGLSEAEVAEAAERAAAVVARLRSADEAD